MELITEGNTKLWVYRGKISKQMEVFYNPAKEFDRDTSVELVKILKPKTFLDLFAASGARGIRIANETDASVYLNDLNPKAVDLIRKNAKENGVDVKIFNEDANKLLVNLDEKLDFIDIDPFGSPIYFVENAIQKIRNGGYLGITATDVAPLYGSAPKRCLMRYGAYSYKVPFSREVGLRILIGAIQRIVSKYDKYAEPIFSFFGGYYYRVYFKLYRKNKPADLGFLSYKDLAREIFPFPVKTICSTNLIGPLYLGNLNKKYVLNKIKYEHKIISLLKEECCKQPFYYTTSEIAKALHVSEVKISKLETLENFSRTHFDPKGFRTSENLEKIKRIFIRAL